MENVVLGLLIIQSLTLYDINQAFKQGISMFYAASYGSLQIALKNLLSKEMIGFEEMVDRGRNKKVYSITPQGRQAFFRWMLEEIPVSKLETTALAKVYFLGLVEDVDQRKQIVREIIAKVQVVEGELNSLNEEIKRYEIPEAYEKIARYRIKTLDYGIKAHAFGRAWFEQLLQELESDG